MRLTSSRAYSRPGAVPKMPPGLVELMEGLTKDVLKNNPSNIYEFCANHLEKLIEIRDGPSSKKSLTLEQKISVAQEKVRQRALERQRRFDNERGESNISSVDVPDEIKQSPEPDVIQNLRAPVHHDEDLSLASEVEISHEPLTDNSVTSKDSNIDEFDDIAISKSSTFSSVSKSTVIDLGNDNDVEETNDEIEASKNKDDNNIEFVDTAEDIRVETVKDENSVSSSENFHTDIAQQEIGTAVPDSKNEQDVKKVSVPNGSIQDTVFDTVLVENQDPLAEELAIGPNEHEQIVQLKSLHVVDVIIEEEDGNIVNIETGQNEISSANQTTDTTFPVNDNSTKNSLTENIEDNLDDKRLNVVLSSDININDTENAQNVDDLEKGQNKEISLIETAIDVTELSDVAENSHSDSISNVIDDTKMEVKDNEDFDPTEALDVLLNGSGMPLAVSNSELLSEDDRNENDPSVNSTESISVVNKTEDIKDEMKPIVNLNENIAVVNEIQDVKNEVIENAHNSGTEDLSAIMEDDHNLENSVEEETDCKNSLENTSKTLPRPGSIENNDDSSVIGSDLSKAEDDLSRSENGQTNMDLETAAVTIQKVFRSFLFKSRNSTFEDITNDDTSYLEEDNDKKEEYYAAAANISKERRPLGITRMDTVLQTVNEEKSLSLSTDDSSTLSSAATTIQAHVRGFLVRNRLNSYKTVSTNSLVNSNEILDDTDYKNKTILNIHIVPEQGNYLSRDESLITSMELSLDGSPPSSINLHPLSYDISERRKLLKREDAIQSISPPSNNSGKLSEDSVKEVLLSENDITKIESNMEIEDHPIPVNDSIETITAVTAVTIRDSPNEREDSETGDDSHKRSVIKLSSDDTDVITPFIGSPRSLVGDIENTSKLVHSGEFHDVVLPTKVSRTDTTVARGE